MTSRSKQTLSVILILGLGALGAWYLWPKNGQTDGAPAERPTSATPRKEPASWPAATAPPASAPATAPAPAAPPSSMPMPPSTAPVNVDAPEAFRRGMELMKADKLIEARNELTDALNAGKLDEPTAEQAKAALIDLADKTIFSPMVYPGDPYCYSYILQPGDILEKLERKLALHVPPDLILRVNGVADASRLRAGQTIKLIRGPFHAVVSKGRCAMDVYLDRTLVWRCKVGVGMPQTPTPEGFFRLRLGGKLRNAAYTPPPSTGLPQKSILPGESDYPLDRKGLWISLTGIGEKGTNYTERDGYGIHGTNDPSTVGRASSNGCIRLADQDIDMAFAVLYEHWSTVTINP